MSLKKIIQSKGFTLREIATKLNISPQALSYQIAQKNIPLRRLQDIARVISCTPADLLSDDDTPTAAPTSFAALVAVGGRTYQPRDVGELLQLAQQLSDDTTTAAGHQDAPGGDWRPVRRRRPTTDVSTTDTPTADHEDGNE